MMSEGWAILLGGIEPLFFLIDPQKRIYWLYLLSSGFIAWVVWRRQGQPLGALRRAVSLQFWCSPSSRVDFCWFFFNHMLRVLLVVPVLGGGLTLAISINRVLYAWFGAGDFWQLPPQIVSVVFTVVLFIAEDFSRFLVHYSYHKIPFLWRFHAIHHSATVLTPITLYRIHWFEMMINSVRSLLVIGSVSALFIYVFDNAIQPVTILGASLFGFLFNMAGSNLRHSHVWLGFGRLEAWVISPAQHQIHHSIANVHIDKNFGATLALWDRLFGTWVTSKGQCVEAFGIKGKKVEQKFLAQQGGL